MKKRHKTTVRSRSTNSQVQRIEKDIRALRDSGKNDIEIRETLGIELRTYQRYMHKIHLEDQMVWLSITQEQLGSELLRLKSSLEETYRISLAMAKDPKYEDKIEALHCKDDARLSIIHLLSEYPDFIRKIPTITQSETASEEKEQDSTLPRIH
jgi:hypothetical protein